MAAGALIFTGVGPGQTIPAVAFGQHVGGIAQAPPQDVTLDAVRLWDTGTRWDEIEPT